MYLCTGTCSVHAACAGTPGTSMTFRTCLLYTSQTVHCDNSAGVMLHPDWPEGLARARCMARPGLILYGYDPSAEVRFGQFRPVMTLKTVVSMVKERQPGQSASYGRRFTADKPTLVATPVSYTHLDVYKRQA